ncbi:oligosaccharide flippase family protein [Portibacter lacus]|uniref:Polysaccharide biosynthesis protein C-terminal domain-containing protein n=1 Tax=Portibacter lacus TaxID=1099794 RepID=A0AA37WFR8_9BACT|nr:polysaccharide biosynthesis C-terminal domain-containing protein [Portibacter lacus]GLR18897.1 hypothetical protein GCM10007940_35130 [Portibacter lacus]
MKKEFTANILFLVGLNLLIKPFYALAIDTSVQNIVGTEAYGIFLALFNFVYIQQIFADLGIQNYNNRKISRNPEQLSSFLPGVLGAKLLFSIGFGILVTITAYFFGYLAYFQSILIWIIASQACLSFLLYVRTNISGSGKYFTDSFISVLDKLILIIWMSYVIWGNPGIVDITISYFVKVQFGSIAITLFFALIYTHRKLTKLSLSIDFSFIKSLLKESLPYASLVLLMAGYSRMDSIMLEQMLNDNGQEAGLYAQSFRLFDTFNNFTFLFAVLLLPMFSRMIKQNEKVNELVSWAFRLLTLGSIFVIGMTIFRGKDILSFFYVNVESEYPAAFLFLMIAGFALSLNYIYGTLLTANGSIKILNYIALFGFVLNLGINYYLIPELGKTGAAFATMITQFVVLMIQVFYSYRIFHLSFSWVNMVKLILMSLVVIVLFYFTNSYMIDRLFISIFFNGLLFLMIAFLIGLIKKSDFKMI